jgi:signal transduction histidine kinase
MPSAMSCARRSSRCAASSRACARRRSTSSDLPASLEVELDADELPPLPAAIEVAAYRIVSEALTNVVRHAHATRCRVTIGIDNRRLRIVIADDGRGAAPEVPPAGHGLQTMRERAEELRGRFSVRSDNGTTVVAELPLPPTQTGAARAYAEARS